MTTTIEAKNKVATAETACSKAYEAWRAAVDALGSGISVNGLGIFRDPAELRAKLLDAHTHVQDALKALDGIDWPTDADYDQL